MVRHGVSAVSQVGLLDHELVPEPGEVDERARHAREVEELALAVAPVEVVHGDLGDAEAVVLHLLHELDADDTGGTRQVHLLEDAPSHEAEVAVHVPQPQAEHRPHEPVVHPADDHAVQGVVARDLVAVDEIHLGPERLDQPRHLSRVVLRVAVRVEDELLGRRGKSASKRAPVAAVLLVVNDPEPGKAEGQLVEKRAGVVGAAVVDDDDLVVVGQPPSGHMGHHDQARDGARVVVGGEEDGEARPQSKSSQSRVNEGS